VLIGEPVATVFPGTLRTENPADLAAIFEPTVGVAVLRRRPCPEIRSFLDSATFRRFATGMSTVLRPGDGGIQAFLPDAPGRGALDADVSALGELYADLVGCPRIGVRLEVLERAMCPLFHSDRVALRLLCTYRGPVTQWLDAAGLIDQAAPFDVVLLKGDEWPDRGGGVRHRSPEVAPREAPRVLLAIDAVW
jgi:hypothetical protein